MRPAKGPAAAQGHVEAQAEASRFLTGKMQRFQVFRRKERRVAEAGVIERYTAMLNGPKLGITVGFIIRITLKGQTDRDLSAFEQAVQGVPEVAECDLTTGESDYVLRVVARDAADFERLHSKVLTKLPGVARVDSSFVLRSVVKNAGLPIEP